MNRISIDYVRVFGTKINGKEFELFTCSICGATVENQVTARHTTYHMRTERFVVPKEEEDK